MTNDVQAAGNPAVDGERRRRRLSRWRRERAPLTFWQELPLLVVVAVVLAVLVKTFALQAFVIPTGSMESTIMVNDRVFVNKLVYDVREPHRGEVIVFGRTGEWPDESDRTKRPSAFGKALQGIGLLPAGTDFIKRVVGLPGETVACCDAQDRILINGKPLDQTAVTRGSNLVSSRNLGFTAPVTVPPGYLFVMGDNREDSWDSRKYGLVPIDSVVGRAFAVMWPVSHWKGLPVPGAIENFPLAALGIVLPVGLRLRSRSRSRRRKRSRGVVATS